MRDRAAPCVVAYTAKTLLKLLLASCRIRVRGVEEFIGQAKLTPCLIMSWHNRLSLLPELLHHQTPREFNYAAFISNSRDGKILAMLASSYSNGGVIPVPHRGRHAALKAVIDTLKSGTHTVVITPDGPRGPPYQVKRGIALAARQSHAAIIPISWRATRVWQLPTWDGLRLPKPFTTIYAAFGMPLLLHEDVFTSERDDADRLKSALAKVEELLK